MLRRALNATPRLKKAVKLLVQPIVKTRVASEAKQYQQWAKRHFASDTELMAQRKAATRFVYQPLISVIVPVYNTPELFFREMVESVLMQTYGNWEMLLVDDASTDSTLRERIKQYAQKDNRVKYKFLAKNRQIAGATNEGIKMAAGEYIALFDHDDVLQPNALYEVVQALNKDRNLAFVYTDEDKITADKDARHQPFFKPDWNPDFLRSINYITHFTVIKKVVLDTYGYEDGRYNGTQDWELFLRITRNILASAIHHIPKVLYGWRVHDSSTAKDLGVKPYVTDAQKRTLEDDLTARKQKGFYVRQDMMYPAQWQLTFRTVAQPKVSIIVHPKGQAKRLTTEIRTNTTYADYEIVLIEPNTSYRRIFEKTQGEYIIFVNDLLKIKEKTWLEDLLGDASREDVGFVLAECQAKDVLRNLKHILSNEAVDFIANSNQRLAARHFYLTARYNVPVIHGGVMMVGKEKLKRAIFDPAAPLDVRSASEQVTNNGLRNLYNPYVKVLK